MIDTSVARPSLQNIFRIFIVHILYFLVGLTLSAHSANALSCEISFRKTGAYVIAEAKAQNSHQVIGTYKIDLKVQSGGNSSRSVQGGKVEISTPNHPVILSQSQHSWYPGTQIKVVLTVLADGKKATCKAESGNE